MSVYFKRFRMRIELPCRMPENFAHVEVQFLNWSDRLVSHHSLAKWVSFRNEMDASVFPCLGEKEGCRQLMRDLTTKGSFIPEATWLAIAYQGTSAEEAIGTIQGLRNHDNEGAIQNVGVAPHWRGHGVGRELLRRALNGFEKSACRHVNLEVTMHNLSAIKLYESIGFRRVETVYKLGHLQLG